MIDPEADATINDEPHHNPLAGISNLKDITGEDIELKGAVIG